MGMVVRKGLVAMGVALLLLAAGNGDYRPSSLDLTVSSYRYSLLNWELSNFLDKWVRKTGDLLPWSTREARGPRNTLAREFFTLGRELEDKKRRLRFPAANAEGQFSEQEAQSLRSEIVRINARRRAIRPKVEEAIESEISAILAQEGFSSRIGLIFPPVDTVYTSSPGVLILSPRDRIERQQTILLIAGLSDGDKEQIEERILREEDLAALVENTGGVAAYPSIVADSGGLHHAVVTTAHEWLHHWFFFQALGQHFWDSAEMTTLNETAATLGGREIGDRAFTAMTGKPVDRESKPETPTGTDVFDFDAAMRETRLRTEELLTQGRIEEAEAYMEERRQLFVANGHLIRKINQAFFAFHGSYADSPASISPINDQLKELRGRSESLEDFLKLVAGFGSHQEFLEYLDSTRRTMGKTFSRPRVR